jgi:WD40 repeat protein
LAKGLISTPTKESTVSQTFTYSGWSLTEGGAASSSALKNVTEDRTVYAAFTSAARKYTARFYDDAGVLMQESQVAYGTKATPPNTAKDGQIFNGWTPSDLTIYGDTDFVGAWAAAKYTLLDNPSGLPTNIYNGLFNPDGTQLILMGKNTESNTQMYVYSVVGDTYTRLFSIDMGSTLIFNSKAYSSDGTRLAIADAKSGSYGVRVYDTTTTPYTLLGKTDLSNAPDALIYSPDNTKLLVGVRKNNGLITLDATQIPYVVTDNLISVGYNCTFCRAMAYNPDKTILALCYDDQYQGAYFYDTASYTSLYNTRGRGYSVAFSPDGKRAAMVLFVGKDCPRLCDKTRHAPYCQR